MSGNLLKYLELSVILIQFISSIITAVYCSLCMSYINLLFYDNDYQFYLSDFKKQNKIHLNISSHLISSPNYEKAIGSLIKATCTDNQCTSEELDTSMWHDYYVYINQNLIFDNENLDFTILDNSEECGENSKKCFSSSYYKTCISKDYPCPITGILSTNISRLNENYKSFFHLQENSTSFIEENNFYAIDDNLMYSTLIDGIPIINTKLSINYPCYWDYMIKSYMFITLSQGGNKQKNATYNFNTFPCYIFNITNSYRDSEGDFDLNKMILPFLRNELNNTKEIFDERYFKLDNIHFDQYIKSIHLDLNYNPELNNNYTISLYTRKLLYAKNECMVKMFKITSQIDVLNMAQLRVLMLRYLHWNFIDIIFIICFNIFLRGYYIFKRLQKKRLKIKSNDDERNFQRETNTVVKLLHYFVIIIKLVSVLVSKYIYMNIDIIPKDNTFYDECVTDYNSAIIYKRINKYILDLFNSISLISNINIYTLVYDIIMTMFVIYSPHMFRKNNKNRKQIKNFR